LINGSAIYQARALMDWNGECFESNGKSMTLLETEKPIKHDAVIYPNPNKGQFKIISDIEMNSIEVYTINGVLISKVQINLALEYDFELPLLSGIYMIKISLVDGVVNVKRLIIE
jgi:hypothetical protein